jgi:hypothetical protein
MTKRIIADIVLFLSLFLASWQWTAILAIIFIILFENFWEAALVGFIIDALYSVPSAGIHSRFGFFTAITLAIILLSKIIKKKIRWFA